MLIIFQKHNGLISHISRQLSSPYAVKNKVTEAMTLFCLIGILPMTIKDLPDFFISAEQLD
jgi:hypothetical protein